MWAFGVDLIAATAGLNHRNALWYEPDLRGAEENEVSPPFMDYQVAVLPWKEYKR